MKKLCELNFYTPSVTRKNWFYSERAKHPDELADRTPTLLFSPGTDKKDEKDEKYTPATIYSGYCRACRNSFKIYEEGRSYTISNLDRKLPVTCPYCNYTHNHEHYRYKPAHNIQPLYIKMRLYDKKDSIELKIIYDGIRLTNDITQKEYYTDVTEKFSFIPEKHSVIWSKKYTDKKNNPVEKKEKIGYITDLKILEGRTAIQDIYYRTKDLNGKTISILYKELKDAINKHTRKAGQGERKMSVNGTYHQLALDALLAIAHRVRFWNEKDIPLYNSRKQNIDDLLKKLQFDPDKEKELEQNIRAGMSYTEAFLTTFDLPDTKSVRKHLCLENASVLTKIVRTIDLEILGHWLESAIQVYHYDKTNRLAYQCRPWIQICISPTSGLQKLLEFYTTYKEMYHKAISFEKALKFCNSVYEPAKSYKELYSFYKDFYKKEPAPEKLYKLIQDNNNRDLARLWKNISDNAKTTLKQNPPKPEALHDTLNEILHLEETERKKQQELEKEKTIYKIPEAVIRRLELSLNNFDFEVMKNYPQLRNAGNLLHNCAKTYHNRIGATGQLVLVSDDKGKPVILMEINNNEICQAKCFANKPVRQTPEYNKVILDFALKAGLTVATKDVDTQPDEQENTEKAEKKIA